VIAANRNPPSRWRIAQLNQVIIPPPQVINPPRCPAKLPLTHFNNSAILEVQYHEVLCLFAFILTELPSKMQNASSSALSYLINNSPLQPQTLVRLLRFRKLASGALNLEGCKNFGDEILDFIEGRKLPSNGNEDGVDSSAEAIADLPYIELLWALYISKKLRPRADRI
jgi:hypothetical protein